MFGRRVRKRTVTLSLSQLEERHLRMFIEKALCRGDREWSFGALRVQAEMGNNGALIHRSVNGPVDLFSFSGL